MQTETTGLRNRVNVTLAADRFRPSADFNIGLQGISTKSLAKECCTQTLQKAKDIFTRGVQYLTPTWVKNGANLCAEHLGASGGALPRTLLLSGFIGVEIYRSYWIEQYFQKQQEGLFEMLGQEKISPNAFDDGLKNFSRAIVYSVGFQILSTTLSSLLTNSLSVAVKEKLTDEWVKSGAYNGLNYLEGGDKERVNPAMVVGVDVTSWIWSSTDLLKKVISVIFAIALALKNLSSIATPPTILTCALVVVIVKMLTFLSSKVLRIMALRTKELESKHSAELQDLSTFSESIALSKGSEFEQLRLSKYIEEASKLQKISTALQSIINFTLFTKGFGSWMLGIFLCKDQLISKEMNIGGAATMGSSLASIIDFATWSEDNFNSIINAETSYQRIESMQSIIKKWSEAMKIRNETLNITKTEATTLSFNGTVRKPNGETLFKGKLSFESGKCYQLAGPTGCGKSTMIRALAGLWPYIKGKMTLPDSTHIIPQSAYIRGHGTPLLDIIRYPNADKADSKEISQIKALMKKFGFNQEHIAHLGDKEWQDESGKTVDANWNKSLSGGEKQRIAIISAILKKPKLLVMDESTSAIDHDMKKIVEDTIKEELKGSIILFIDHNPSDNFANESVDLDAKSGKEEGKEA